jgi:hypothetical protein
MTVSCACVGNSGFDVMHRIRSPRFLAFFFALLLSACFQRFIKIHTVEAGQGVAFEVQEIADGLKQGHVYEVLDLTVMRRNCEKDCTMWFIVRESSQAHSGNLDAARIVYGLEPQGMVLKAPAKTLEPGSYTVSATVQQYDATGKFIKSLSLDGDFSIYQDESGKQRVSQNTSTGDTHG